MVSFLGPYCFLILYQLGFLFSFWFWSFWLIFFGVCLVLFVFLFFLIFHLNYFCVIMFVFFFNPCLIFVFAFFFRHLSFDQRRPSTFVSNSIESFCVPRSWTANFSRRSKRHRTHGERLLRSFHLINQIFLPKQKKKKQKTKKKHISFCRLLVSQ